MSAGARLQATLDDFDRENAEDIAVEDFNVGQDELVEVSAADLRALLKAREEAQPVAKPAPFDQGGIGHAMYQAFHAYRADYVLSTDGSDYEPIPFERDLIEDFFAGLMAEEAFFGPIRALYDAHTTPPAPEAEKLRAVTSREIAARLNPALFSDDEKTAHRAASPHTVSIARVDAIRAVEVILEARQALAALQQEGRP